MKQGQLNTYFKKLTLVPGTSNGDERGEAGAAVDPRPTPALQKQPAARPKVLHGVNLEHHVLLGRLLYFVYSKKKKLYKAIVLKE